jgi:glycosyltransferase involved in cell wall biosynthesis
VPVGDPAARALKLLLSDGETAARLAANARRRVAERNDLRRQARLVNRLLDQPVPPRPR